MTRRRAEALLVLVTVLWGGTFVVVKGAVETTSPLAFVALRFGLATAVAMALWPASFRAWTPELVRRGAILGVLFGAGFVLQTFGLQSTSASASAFITGTNMAFVPFVAWVIARRPVTVGNIVSIVVVLLGLWIFTDPATAGMGWGEVLTLASSFVWAWYLTMVDRWTHTPSADELNAIIVLQCLVTTLLAGGIGMGMGAIGHMPAVTWSGDLLWAVLYCGLAAGVVTTALQTRYQRYTEPVRAGLIFALEPVAAAAIAIVVFGDMLETHEVIGAIVLLTGVAGPDVFTWLRTSADEGHTA